MCVPVGSKRRSHGRGPDNGRTDSPAHVFTSDARVLPRHRVYGLKRRVAFIDVVLQVRLGCGAMD